MTVDQLLQIAQTYTGYAAQAGDHDQLDKAGVLAAIAQAAAMTAQAMTFTKIEQLQNDLDDCQAFRAAAEKAAEDRLCEIARLRSALF